MTYEFVTSRSFFLLEVVKVLLVFPSSVFLPLLWVEKRLCTCFPAIECSLCTRRKCLPGMKAKSFLFIYPIRLCIKSWRPNQCTWCTGKIAFPPFLSSLWAPFLTSEFNYIFLNQNKSLDLLVVDKGFTKLNKIAENFAEEKVPFIIHFSTFYVVCDSVHYLLGLQSGFSFQFC